MIAARPAPSEKLTHSAWLRRNLFYSPVSALFSLALLAAVLYVLWQLLAWIFFAANWQQLWNNLKLFAVYRYPADLLARPLLAAGLLTFLLGASSSVRLPRQSSEALPARNPIARGVFIQVMALLLVLSILGLGFWQNVRFGWLGVFLSGLLGWWLGRYVPWIRRSLPLLWLLVLTVSLLILHGIKGAGADSFWRLVPTRDWGGFMLTIILSVVGIVVSIPLGVALALGRRSKLPAIKYVCIAFIELVRGAPLITWLYIASLLLPLLLNIEVDRISALNKALVALTIFTAVYMAENVRGGLAAVSTGQEEAARALGLSPWQSMRLIVLPQALRAVIPGIVGQSISLFKDTSLVLVVGLQDFFQVHNIVSLQPASLQVQGGVRLELSLFLAFIYWFFAFRMSRASRQLEAQLGVGKR